MWNVAEPTFVFLRCVSWPRRSECRLPTSSPGLANAPAAVHASRRASRRAVVIRLSDRPPIAAVYGRFGYRRWTASRFTPRIHRVDDLRPALGRRIRRLRLRRGWTQEELAFRAGVNKATMSDIERGKSDAAFSSLCKVSGAFGMTVARLLNGVE